MLHLRITLPQYKGLNVKIIKGYKIAELAKDFVHFSNLLLVLQVDGSIEVGHLVLLRDALAHNIIFTRVHELPQFYDPPPSPRKSQLVMRCS